ncbi:NAD(P) transhydrogenase subunit alpha [Posidoniimonas polymericola]|uniref:NAD(P) transhydrogenase subunit alpha n=1 Tax=Posidoniimonas polymericola TaxID=2528002 RepID=A0A5C5XSN5_9BACT|nr:Re/Si-specific NAD(P)(+) transhydrogenase subunit alpha [Posidoniimonas polymericola]TWT65900.1 NAD(P) transhydrogenase subunit alpha [Posidoniimonas polymericola]
MRIAIPRETAPGERRVAASPDSVRALLKLGHSVAIESGAGEAAGFTDDAYRDAGAEVTDHTQPLWFDAELVLKVRPPSDAEVELLEKGDLLACYLQPAQNGELLAKLAAKGVTALALEAVPRITRAQSMDTLSAMANIAGYRAVVEAASNFGRFFGGQMTAAGRLPPAKVLVIGAGVAGLAAVGAAKGLGAVVRAFDTRPATKEQVESLGGEFLTVEIEESGEGAGGYAKEVSQAFLDAEFALFRAQAQEVDIVITTALIPGKPAPKLWLKDMVELMKPGSVVVDLAGEQGGNCEYTEPGQKIQTHGVTVIGYTDLVSRMADTASALYANVMVNLIKHLGGAEPQIDMDDTVTRAITVTHDGAVTWPPPPLPAPTPAAAPPAKPAAKPTEAAAPADDRRSPLDAVMIGAGLLLAAVWLYMRFQLHEAPGATGGEAQQFVQHLTVFVMACIVGWHVIWNVSAALHTPLMAVTNAISGIIIVGGLLTGGSLGEAGFTPAVALGLVAILLAMINVAGGFLVTQRMLKMFRRG